MHASTIDITGQTFGKLFVVERSTRKRHWRCRCSCGVVLNVRADHIHAGAKGCRSCSSGGRTHGLSGTVEHGLWESCRGRAKKQCLPFTIKVTDIKIPVLCPLLGEPLERGTRSVYTASVDQIVPGLGYTPANVWVISWRANQIKSNLTLEQWEKFVAVIRKATL